MRLLQRGLLRHVGLKISALLIAVALWVVYNSQPVVEASYSVPLLLENVPPGLQVAGEVPSTVLVRLRGRLGRMRPLNPDELSVSANFYNAHAGFLTVQLVPNDPNIVGISPAQLQFSLVSASAPQPQSN
jgi:hypothetical protein